MKKITFLSILSLCSIGLLPICEGHRSTQDQLNNNLIISIDCANKVLNAYSGLYKTSDVDLLAMDGLNFTNVFLHAAPFASIEAEQGNSANQDIKLKPAIEGLVSMGYVGGILRKRGKNGAPSDGTGSPVEDLNDVFSKPDIFSGAVFNLAWKELEPEQGKFTTKIIDDQLARVRDYNKKYPNTPLGIRLRISCGIAAPEWAKNIGGKPVNIIDPKGNYLTIGRFWSDEYIAAWRNFQNNLARLYDNEPLIADVTVTSGMTNSDENLNLATHPYALENMHPAGFTDALYIKMLEEAGEDYKSWAKTRINFLINPFKYTDTDKPIEDKEFTVNLMKFYKKKYGERAILSNHSFQSPHTERLEFIYQGIKELGWPFDYQTHSPKGINMEATVKDAALIMGATTLELWNAYVTYPNEDLLRWKALFKQNKK